MKRYSVLPITLYRLQTHRFPKFR